MNSNEIKTLIKEYIFVDDEISAVSKQVKEIRKKKTDLEEKIKQYMLDNLISAVDIGSGSLRISKTKPTKKINKKIILETLLESLDEDKAHDIIEGLFKEDENEEEIVKLERSKKTKKN